MDSRVGLTDFWKERFGDNRNTGDWFSEFSRDISYIASLVKIDWEKSKTSNMPVGQLVKDKDVAVTDHKRRHFMELNWREARNKIVYPVIQFTSHVDGTQFWNGYESLLELFEREGGQVLSDLEREKNERRRAKREAEQKAKEEAAQRKHRIQEKHATLKQLVYQRRWERGDFETSNVIQHPYAERKGITAAVINAGMASNPEKGISLATGRDWIYDPVNGKKIRGKKGKWLRGYRHWLAIPMFNLGGRYVGHQRIYDDGFKAHAPGSRMAEAHYIIGDIEAAEIVDYVEGYATGSSIFKAHQLNGANAAVVVCFDKNGLSRIVSHFAHRYEAKKHTIRADNDHGKWLEGKGNAGKLAALELQGQLANKKVKASAPDFSDITAKNNPTDYNDLEMDGSLRMVAQQLSNSKLKLGAEKNMLANKLQLLALTGKQSWKKYAKSAAAAGCHFIPHQLDRQTVLNSIFDAVPAHIHVSEKDRKAVKKFINWMIHNRYNEAGATKNFSEEALQGSNINHIKVPAEISPQGFPVIPAHVMDMVRGLHGSTILKAKHGTGKTERVMGPLMHQTEGGTGMIVHRVTLANQMANELSLKHYKELDHINVGWNTNMVTCVNSIIRREFDWFWNQAELLCVDEATQVLRHVMSGQDAIHAPVKAYNRLLTAAREAGKVLLADADANDSLIDFLNQARPGDMINIIEIVSPAAEMTVNYCDNVEFVYQNIIETARKKTDRILVATDTRKKSEALAEGIRGVWPEARILCVTSETKGDEKQLAFSNDPNTAAQDIDVLIYSPVISSGVSIKNAAASFDKHFGLFHGVVVPSDILQMVRRDRGAKQFTIGFQPNHEQRQTDRDELLKGLILAYQNSSKALNFTDTDDGIIIEKTPFDDMYLNVRIQEAKARNEYTAHTLMLMAGEGWKVNRLEVNELTAELGAEQIAGDRDLVKAQRHDLINSQTTPTEDEYKQLKRAEIITQAQAAQIARYEIENHLGVDVTQQSIDFFDGSGMTKVRRLELVRGDYDAAAKIDTWEQKKQIVLTQRRLTLAKWQKLREVFRILNIDPATGNGQYSIDQAREVTKLLTGTEAARAEYNALRIGPQSKFEPKCPTRFVKGLLERFSPVVNGKKVNGVQFYQFQQEKFAELSYYIRCRSAIGQNSLNIDSTAEYHDDNYAIASIMSHTTMPETPYSVVSSEGGENIEHNIRHNSEISPEQKHILISVLNWIKTTPSTIQNSPGTGMLEQLQRAGKLTLPVLMRIARGWLDPQRLDDRWGKIQPVTLQELTA